MDVPRCHGIANPEQLKSSVLVAPKGLRCALQQCPLIDRSSVARQRAERVIQRVVRLCCMLDEQTIGLQELPLVRRVVRAQLDAQTIVMARHADQSRVDRRRDLMLGKHPRRPCMGQSSYVGSKRALRRHIVHSTALVRQQLCQLHARLRAVVVVERDMPCSRLGSCQDVPSDFCQFFSVVERRLLWRSPRGDHDDVRFHGGDLLVFEKGVVVDLTRHAFDLRQSPRDDGFELGTPSLREQADLSSRVVCGFKERYGQALFQTDPRRFQPCRTRADDDDFSFVRALVLSQVLVVRHVLFASAGGVVDAQHVLSQVEAVDAIARAYAGSDLVFSFDLRKARDVRLGKVRARHADDVDFSFADGVACIGDRCDARGVQDRHFREGLFDLADKVDVRACSHAARRNDMGKGGVGVDSAADDIEKIAARLAFGGAQRLGDGEARFGIEPLLRLLVERHADADRKGCAQRRSECGE